MDDTDVTPLPSRATATAQDRDIDSSGDLQRLMLAGHALVDGCQAVNAEMLAFWQSRIKAGVETAGHLLGCASLESAWEIQLDYAKTALQAYLDQSAKISGLAMRSLTDGVMPKSVAAMPERQTSPLAA